MEKQLWTSKQAEKEEEEHWATRNAIFARKHKNK